MGASYSVAPCMSPSQQSKLGVECLGNFDFPPNFELPPAATADHSKDGSCGIPSGLRHRFRLDLDELAAIPCDTARGPLEEFAFKSGATYRGHWRGNARHGFGVQRWPDGSSYEGEWKDNEAEGRGRYTFSDGDSYAGEWRASAFHGIGVYRGSDGTVYQGHWICGNRDGTGVEVGGGDELGINYAGHFKEGRRDGVGVCTWPDGGEYCGEWSVGRISGKGVHKSPGGTSTYGGEWCDSERQGLGRNRWADGRVYEGQYKNNVPLGIGRYTWPRGRQAVGFWATDQTFNPFDLDPVPSSPKCNKPSLRRSASQNRVRISTEVHVKHFQVDAA